MAYSGEAPTLKSQLGLNLTSFQLTTTTATPTLLTTDGGALVLSGASTNVLKVPYNSVWRIRIDVAARRADVTGEYATWTIVMSACRDGSGVARSIGSPTVWNDYYGAGIDFLVKATIDTTDPIDNYLAITATGATGRTIQWTASVYITEAITTSLANAYIADEVNHRIRKVTPAGVVTTLAGSTSGYADGTGAAAQFSFLRGIGVDASGIIYVADTANSRIRKITPAGVVTTLAGLSAGFADGTGTVARFNNPYGLAVDKYNNLLVADQINHRIRKVTPAGVVTTVAGSGTAGYLDGSASTAQFKNPRGVALDVPGNIYVADYLNHCIRKISATDGAVSTVAGTGGVAGFLDGNGNGTKFNSPTGLDIDPSGNIFVADQSNHCIRKITSTGVVTTFAGQPTIAGYADGSGATALFSNPREVATDNAGNVYITDYGNNRIRKITPDGMVSTLAGQTTAGTTDGTGTAAQFSSPYGIAFG